MTKAFHGMHVRPPGVLRFFLCSLGAIGLSYAVFGPRVILDPHARVLFVLPGLLAGLIVVAACADRRRWLLPVAVFALS